MTKRARIPHILVLLLLCLLPVSLRARAQDDAATFDWVSNYNDFEKNRFALELPLTPSNFDMLKARISRYRYLIFYLPANELGDASSPNLRIGFFGSYREVQDFNNATQHLFRQQHIVRVSSSEHQLVMQALTAATSKPTDTTPDENNLLVFPIDPGNTTQFQQNQRAILERAKRLYLDRNYSVAAQHYLLLANLADPATAAWARELAGLCFEKAGHRELAVEQYRQLLKLYPESNGAKRVTQRLRGLETALADDPLALKKVATTRQADFFTRGVFGQYYRTVERSDSTGSNEEVLSLLTTDWDVRSSLSVGDHDFNARVSGYWLEDELDSDNSEVNMRRFLIDYRHQRTGAGAVIGRQRDSDSGVFLSFDGVTLSYPLWETLRVSVSGGEPVYNSDIYDELDYFFYSVHLRWDFSDRWQASGYVVNQTVNDVTDREAVGLRGRYADDHLTTSVYIDYDTAFSELNNMLININYRFNDSTDITALYGSQRSPFLTASNILIGQADLDLDAYLAIKENRDSLLDDAFARTALNDYYSLSFSTQLQDDVRWIIDCYDSTLNDVPSSEFLLGLPDTGSSPDSFHYQSLGTQLIFQNFMIKNDSATVGWRQSSSDTSDTNQVYLYERMRIGSAWTIVPRIMYSRIEIGNAADTQQQVRYSLNLIYRPLRNLELNVEAGNESISSDETGIDFDSRYLFVGYRVNF